MGLAQSFSYGALGILNTVRESPPVTSRKKFTPLQVIMSDDSSPVRFLIFFLSLAGCSLLSVPTTWFVADKRREDRTAK